jgi:hypothetical protein
MAKDATLKRPLQCMLGSNEWPAETVEACLSRVLHSEQENDPALASTLDSTLDSTFDPTLDHTLDPTLDSTLDSTLDPTRHPTSLEGVESIAGAVNTTAIEPPRQARPSRAAKRRALENIHNIHRWENCSESSAMFKQVARHVEMELKNEVLQREEKVHVESDEDLSNVSEGNANSTVDSDDESESESMKDFIVPDDEDVDENQDSEASFRPSDDEEEFVSEESDEDDSDTDTVYESAQEEDVHAFFANANAELDTV